MDVWQLALLLAPIAGLIVAAVVVWAFRTPLAAKPGVSGFIVKMAIIIMLVTAIYIATMWAIASVKTH